MSAPEASETPQNRLKRLHMRSIRRGIREMDLILSRFAETDLPELGPTELDLYEALLSENDQDLYRWVTGQAAPPEVYAPLMTRIVTGIVPGLGGPRGA
ncbi:succinate dehydrogenase assembly factor 2 [Poseidonocella sedimentorum]|uniref:FAD assembly factor SdhE n=1 Tax=Poseidonocella sedimentorum TaxID=871652 RepID=A0A1I6EN96_9RHOB|nr:succinate dehydrogenase assembly factor 2 [Poseidonocella sedimentorum]SFR19061.1 antitoxin CptB [Poseidonocella sedimentorum]